MYLSKKLLFQLGVLVMLVIGGGLILYSQHQRSSGIESGGSSGQSLSDDFVRKARMATPTPSLTYSPLPPASKATPKASNDVKVTPGTMPTATVPTITPVVCNPAQAQSDKDYYDAMVAAENSRHTSSLSSISSDWNSRGMLYSGGYQQAVDNENNYHQYQLSQLQVNYQTQLATHHCV